MNIDFDRLRMLLQPFRLRVAGLLQSLLSAFLSAVARVKGEHDTFRSDTGRLLEYDSRVKNLRRALSDVTGCPYELVRIGDTEDRNHLILYADGYGNPVVLDNSSPIWLWSEGMISYTREFSVEMPMAYVPYREVVCAMLDAHKLAGTKYTLTFN